MRICYIKQAEEIDEYINYTNKLKSNFIKKVIKSYKTIFNKVTVKPIGDSIILFVAKKKYKEIKLASRVAKKLKYYTITDIVLENKFKSDYFKNVLFENNLNILDGRWLFKYILVDILEYIANIKNEKVENMEVTLLVNDLDEVAVSNIYEIANNIKRLNIVTNNMGKVKYIENKLYEEKGIMITVSDNKRKSLAKSKIIINLDFPEETINRYNINKKAILINIENKIKIQSKSFCGININYYDLEINTDIMNKFIEKGIYNNFDKTLLYESVLYSKNRFNTIRERIKKDKIKLSGLIGNNGLISEKEFYQN